MNDRYMVISPDTLEAMRRAGHAAKLEARIEKLEAALRELGQPITLSDPDWVYRYPNFTPQDAIDMHSLLLNRINIAKNAPMTEADFEEARNRNLGVKALEEKDD